jgi:hypothetical protein
VIQVLTPYAVGNFQIELEFSDGSAVLFEGKTYVQGRDAPRCSEVASCAARPALSGVLWMRVRFAGQWV